jgi:hypothetical protein
MAKGMCRMFLHKLAESSKTAENVISLVSSTIRKPQ